MSGPELAKILNFCTWCGKNVLQYLTYHAGMNHELVNKNLDLSNFLAKFLNLIQQTVQVILGELFPMYWNLQSWCCCCMFEKRYQTYN
jgi:hypothetical protein